jgi:hypothetical protein
MGDKKKQFEFIIKMNTIQIEKLAIQESLCPSSMAVAQAHTLSMLYTNGLAGSVPKFAFKETLQMCTVGNRKSTEGLIGIALPITYM